MRKIIFILFLVNATQVIAANNSGSFTKVDKNNQKNILSESKTQATAPDAWLQPVKGRSLEYLRLMMGTALNAKSVGPSVQAEWSLRLSQKSPFFVTSGIGYFIETKNNSLGSPRNFHNLPVLAAGGYSQKFYKNLRFNVLTGPVLRMSFERGTVREENHAYSYGDLMAAAGLDYEWTNNLTGDGRSVGLRASRYFGLSGRPEANAFDSLLASFTFDL